jgi:chromosome partitioning protein
MPRIVVIANLKGGAGKSTVTALLGYGLAVRGRKVLLIDLDPQSHLSSFFIPVELLDRLDGGSLDLVRYGISETRIHEFKFTSGVRLFIIPSKPSYSIDLMSGQAPLMDPLMLYRRLEEGVEDLQDYDYIIMDTAPEPFAPTMWGLYASDYVIIPTSLEELSLYGIKMLVGNVLPSVYKLRKSMVRGPPWLLGIVLNNITRHYKEETIVKDEDALRRFIRGIHLVAGYAYPSLFFRTRVYSDYQLSRLPHTPRRQRIPIDAVIEGNAELKNAVVNLAGEVEDRIKEVGGGLSWVGRIM